MPANYEQPKDVVKRVRFFDGQFLKDQDFIDDQKYHIDRQRRPNRLLRVSGICEGLVLIAEGDRVKVTPGTALDNQGRLIVLGGDPFAVDLKDQTGAVDIFIAYGNEESDITQANNERTSASANDPMKGAKGATRWWEKPRIEAVKDRAELKGENPLWLGRVTVSGSGANRTVALTTMDDREYSGVYLPSSANPFEAPVLRSGGNVNPKLAVLTGDLKIRGSAADSTTHALTVTNSTGTNLLTVRNDGDSTFNGKLTVNSVVSLKGSATATGLTVDSRGNVSMGSALAVSAGLSFGSATRQMINLWSTEYGIGIQSNTQYFRTDKNFAWYKGGSHVDSELGAGANGTIQMVIKDGNVGIGTADPKGFQVTLPESSSKPGAGVTISGGASGSTGGNAKIELRNNGTGTPYIDFARDADTGDFDARLRLVAAGKLAIEGAAFGIGTTTPEAKLAINGGLHVGGDSDPGDNNLLVDGALSFGSATRQMINLWGSSNYGIGIQNSTQYFRTDKNFAWYKGGAHSNDELNSGANGTVQMVIKDGNVGIGTSSPGAKLHIINKSQDANGNTLILGPTDGSNLRLGYHTNYSWIQSHGSKPIVINPAGNNVGIGTDSPGQKLTVQGTFDSGKHSGSSLDHGGNIAIISNAPQIDFIDTDNTHNDWAIHVNSSKMYFIRQPWNHTDLVLDGAGNVGIGTDSPSNQLDVRGWMRLSGGGGINFFNDAGQHWQIYPQWSDAKDPDLMFDYSHKTREPNWARGWLDPQGGWNAPSDARLKRDIKPLKKVLDDVMKLQPKSYHWTNSPGEPLPHIGFIAQEVEQVFPDFVNNKHTFRGLNYHNFTVVAIAAIQEQQALITALKADLANLKSLLT